jgi:ABC-2 type transport system permease protein
VCWDLTRQIRLGELDALLLRPAHPVLHHMMSNFAALPMRAFMALPLGVGVLIFAGGGDPVAWGDVLRTLPTLALAWGIVFSIQLAVACLAFWLTSATSLYEAWLAVHLVLSGYLLPTSLFPERFAEVIRVLPFHAALGFPVEVLTGRLSHGAYVEGIGLQCFWVACFSVLAAFSWRRGLTRYGSVGA